jgi:hypothetical protein
MSHLYAVPHTPVQNERFPDPEAAAPEVQDAEYGGKHKTLGVLLPNERHHAPEHKRHHTADDQAGQRQRSAKEKCWPGSEIQWGLRTSRSAAWHISPRIYESVDSIM